ncbi:olfactory receptor 477-like [Thamnophis elegans]|uniref:olfactory receptor 477-like n=1 Tax=Thamnophis elegans TaxID=35005 RepID=UPI00137659FF|nr:olfactory receptor 477-like [Thamnophis elegans]
MERLQLASPDQPPAGPPAQANMIDDQPPMEDPEEEFVGLMRAQPKHKPQPQSAAQSAAGVPCPGCGGRHTHTACPFRTAICRRCKGEGHIAKVCRALLPAPSFLQSTSQPQAQMRHQQPRPARRAEDCFSTCQPPASDCLRGGMIEAVNFNFVKEFIFSGFTSDRKIQLLLFVVILIIYLLTVLGNLLIIILIQVDVQLNTPIRMEAENVTSVKEFILLGLTSQRKIQLFLFVVILLVYMLTVLGNLLIIIVVQIDIQLHIPMYYFLSHFAGVEICYVTSTMPLMLTHLLTGNGVISFAFCIIQIYVALTMASMESYLLCVMAYDRYLAICRPLIYATAMSKQNQWHFALACWVIAPVLSAICVISLAGQTYCGPNQINHFICEIPVVMKLACSDTHITKLVKLAIAASGILVPLSVILTTYGYILYSVSHMKSNVGLQKAFSTCGSHLIVVVLFYGTIIYMYMIPKSASSPDHDKQIAVFYVVVTPLLNPIIYTLRNKSIHRAVSKIL